MSTFRSAVAAVFAILVVFTLLDILLINDQIASNKPIYGKFRRTTEYRSKSSCDLRHSTRDVTVKDIARVKRFLLIDSEMGESDMKDFTEPQLDMSQVRYYSPNGTRLTVDYILNNTCSKDYAVPNILHYVLPFRKAELKFYQLVCILSGFHVAKPDKIIFWFHAEPHGEYWEYLKSNISSEIWNKKVIMAYRKPPYEIYGNPIYHKEHKSDVIRLEALITFGGIYMDLDAIVLRPLDPLRKHPMTIGRETDVGLCNAIFLASKDNFFLHIWHLTYQFFNGNLWNYHSVMIPNYLNALFPGTCHVEEDTLVRPSWIEHELKLIYGQERSWDWRQNYAVHFWYRFHNEDYDFVSIRNVDNMFGDLCRLILFGSTEIQLKR